MHPFYGCYLLVSLGTKNAWSKGRTYIGFTVDPRRRIRQHNGDVANGASKTVKGRPWEMMLVLYGFPTKTSALQFEWAWQNPEISKVVRDVATQLGKKKMTGAAGKVRLLFEMLHCSPWKYFPFKMQFFTSKSTELKEGCRPPPPHVEVFVAPMEDLPDIVVDNGRNPSCDSEGEAHVSEQCLESSSLTNNGMKNESTTIEKVLGGKNKQLCSICETPARTTWLSCDCQSVFHIECLAEAFLDVCENLTATLPVRGHCPKCTKEHSWIGILGEIQSTSKWSQKKPKALKKGVQTKKVDFKDEEHEETRLLPTQDNRISGKGIKRPRQHLSDEHNDAAAGGDDGKKTSCGTEHMLLSPSPESDPHFVCLLTPTPAVEQNERKEDNVLGESMSLLCDSSKINQKKLEEQCCRIHTKNLMDLTNITPQRACNYTSLPCPDPQSTKRYQQVEELGSRSVVDLLTPEAFRCPINGPEPSLVILTPKDTNTTGSQSPCGVKSRKKERGSPDSIHSVSTLPLRERIERRLKGDQGNQKDQVKKGMENG